MRLLMADDHVMVRDGLRPFLQEIASDVEVFETGRYDHMLETLAATPGIGMLILDLRLPGMDLPEGIRTVRDRHPDLAIAVLSSVTDRKLVLATLAQGVAGFIPKRLSAQAMVSALRLIVAGERYVPAAVIEDLAADGGRWSGADTERRLTNREREILDLLREGLSNKLIARRLNVSEVTVKSHLCHVFRKLGVQNRVQAARFDGGR